MPVRCEGCRPPKDTPSPSKFPVHIARHGGNFSWVWFHGGWVGVEHGPGGLYLAVTGPNGENLYFDQGEDWRGWTDGKYRKSDDLSLMSDQKLLHYLNDAGVDFSGRDAEKQEMEEPEPVHRRSRTKCPKCGSFEHDLCYETPYG